MQQSGSSIASLALAILLAAGPGPLMAQTAGVAPVEVSIAAQPLGQALNELARQADLQLLFPPALVAGKTAPAVAGKLTPREAVDQLLAGSGLVATQEGPAIVIRAAATDDSGAMLAPVTVTASVERNATTEGSGRYGSNVGTTALPFNATLRDTPQSISIISSQLIEDRKIDRLFDVIEQATGLSLNRYESNRGSLFARGFNITNYLIDGAPTGIDEQWSAGEVFSNTAIYDRVEILRGSDGLMTGVGNPSAVINMVRKRADSRVFKGSVSAEVGSWSQRGVTADVSTPLTGSGSTRVRFVADYDEGKSYIDRLKNREQIFYATVEQDIGDRSLLAAGISHQDNHTDSPTWGGIPGWLATNANDAVQSNWRRSMTTAPEWSYWDADYTNWFVRGEHDFGNGWRVKAGYTRGDRNSEAKIANFYQYGSLHPVLGTSFIHMELFPGFTYSMPMSGYAGLYYVDNTKEDVNVQVEGEFQLFGRDHQVAFGYDHSDERLTTVGNPGNTSTLVFPAPNLYTWDGSGYEPVWTYPVGSGGTYIDQKVTQKAWFLAGRFSLAEPLKLILGTRVIDYGVVDYKNRYNDFKAENEVIPYAGLVFDLTRNLSAYASYTTIFEPQSKRDASNKQLAPVEGNTREVGLKGAFFDNRLNASLSVFKMQQENVAKVNGYISGITPPQTAYAEVDGVVSEGFEVEIAGEIRPGWNASIGYAKFRAKDAGGTDVNSLIPRQQFNAFTSYRLPGAWNGLTVGGGVRWQSRTYADALFLTGKKLEQKAYSVVDLMARYEIDKQWSLQLNVNNVLDEKYFSPPESGLEIFWQEPRNASLRLKYQF
ncbi:TonB-dependent siderophore receptor [Pseudothauera rhizosphaerae]|uniref:TonB-dependent siderophore receptor n=1 Tax=Pseudothauera rhizosphaerae TaxID=2565932 RepID=A0A4V3WAI7_9RHOO|nr:TonB-dependent siderophore receptor [Pseudothauera rhizosphaerae]THF59442.1 TonB-dependent siderophore receptor [Pseudothauera rhizosphaerae]